MHLVYFIFQVGVYIMNGADKIGFTMTDEEFQKLLDELLNILLEIEEESGKY